MKGYLIPYGYMGWIPSMKLYILFENEEEYIKMYKEWEAT